MANLGVSPEVYIARCASCGGAAHSYYRVWDSARNRSLFLCGPCSANRAVVDRCECCQGAGLILAGDTANVTTQGCECCQRAGLILAGGTANVTTQGVGTRPDEPSAGCAQSGGSDALAATPTPPIERTSAGPPPGVTLYPQAEVDVLIRKIGRLFSVLALVEADASEDHGYFVLRRATIAAVRKVLSEYGYEGAGAALGGSGHA